MKDGLTRRAALKAGGLAALSAPAPSQEAGPRTRIAVSTYSYWHFRGEKYPIEKVIEDAARLGFDGVEILHRQMASEAPEYVNRLKRLAFLHGLDLVMLSIHQGFVSPDPAVRRKNVDHTRHCIELAARLGIPCIRLNSGRWGTVKSFDELMKVRGAEPPLPGYTDEDAF
ncbi:MAG: sugar phosphate isomerase/epimerase, partial [Bryobacteraceae bacterium]|nr:sugar phosphate isomerase/epimerase [Bryobacteraceae bacterium]